MEKQRAIWEEATDRFDDDISVLVEGLFLLEGIHQEYEKRIFPSNGWGKGLTDVEQWLLARVGLSKWLAPHLCICLDVVKNGVERIAESELGDIFLGDEGIVLLGDNHPVAKELNSSFLCFLKSLVLLSSFIDQSRLVFGGDAYQRKETLPQPMINALANAFEKIDPGHSQVWMRLAELQ